MVYMQMKGFYIYDYLRKFANWTIVYLYTIKELPGVAIELESFRLANVENWREYDKGKDPQYTYNL
jgi:hypothetical protein